MNIFYIAGVFFTTCTVAGVAVLYRIRKAQEYKAISITSAVDAAPNSLWHKIIQERELSYLHGLWNFEEIGQTETKVPNLKASPYDVGTKFQYTESLSSHNSNTYFLKSSDIGEKKA